MQQWLTCSARQLVQHLRSMSVCRWYPPRSSAQGRDLSAPTCRAMPWSGTGKLYVLTLLPSHRLPPYHPPPSMNNIKSLVWFVYSFLYRVLFCFTCTTRSASSQPVLERFRDHKVCDFGQQHISRTLFSINLLKFSSSFFLLCDFCISVLSLLNTNTC